MKLPKRPQLLFNKGFTLLELVMAVALIAILGALALPVFFTWLQSAKVRSVAEALQNDLRLAQGEAIRRNRNVTFSLINDPANATPVIYTPSVSPSSIAAVTTGTNWMAYIIQLYTGDSQVASTQVQYVAGGDNGNLESPVQIAGNLGTSSGTANGTLIFTPFGRMSGQTQAQIFTVSRPNSSARTLEVTVTPSGQVRMCDPNRSITTSPDGC